MHASSGIRTHDPGIRAVEDSTCLRPRGQWDRHYTYQLKKLNKYKRRQKKSLLIINSDTIY
jgi:hypothetical protein